MVQTHERGEHVVGALGVELRRRLVEHEGRRCRGQRARDHAALPLAPRKRRWVTVAQRGDAERIQRLLHPPTHGFLRVPEVLEYERDVALDMVDDELRLRILGDEADHVGELAGRVRAG